MQWVLVGAWPVAAAVFGASGDSVAPITAGLGALGAALVVGQWLVYRYQVIPERARSDRALAEEKDRNEKALATERAWASAQLATEASRTERLEAEVRALNKVLQDQALPALIAATAAVTASQDVLRDLRRDQEVAARAQWERDRGPSRGAGDRGSSHD